MIIARQYTPRWPKFLWAHVTLWGYVSGGDQHFACNWGAPQVSVLIVGLAACFVTQWEYG